LSKIIGEVDHGTRVVAGVQVRVTELVWSHGGTSFEVHEVDTGTDLTEAECFDHMPTDEQIAALLPAPAGWFACRGCGAVFSDDQGDLYVDHVRDCDRVDGAGNPLPAQQ
jgi:hypothetical protein